MAYTFQYYVQGDFTGTTRDGDVSFVVQKLLTATIDNTSYDYTTGKIISPDLNGDLVADTVYQILESLVQEYCLRYSIDINTVSMQRVNTWAAEEHSLANVYFNPASPSSESTNPNDVAYAYLLSDSVINPPTNAQTFSTDTTVVISWEHTGHALGFRIYNHLGTLLATVTSGPLEWMHTELEPSTDYTYRITAYDLDQESSYVEVHAQTEGLIEELPDRIIPEDTKPVIDHNAPIVDHESEQLHAFQSGIGDSLDLFVKTDKEYSTRELVTYEMQIRGFEVKTVSVYEKREFRYRIHYQNSTGAVIHTSVWYDGYVDGEGEMLEEGSGKKDLIVPVDLAAFGATGFTSEMNDPSGFVRNIIEVGQIKFSSRTDASTPKEIRTPFYGPRVKGKGIYTATGIDIITIHDEVPSPYYDSTFYKEDGVQRNIQDWNVLVFTQNPNVRVWLYERPLDFWLQKKFIRVRLNAQIINVAQTPWTPMIHNGYYYLNQSERFLYSETEVSGWLETAKRYAPFRFDYSIDTYATREIPEQVQEFNDVDRIHFIGSLNNTTLEVIEGDLTLLDNNLSGSYISSPKVFHNTATYYEPITWNAEAAYGSTLKIFTQVKSRDGEWLPWVEEVNGEVIKSPLSRELRYKVEMTPGDKKNLTITEYIDDAASEFVLGINQNRMIPALYINTSVSEDTVILEDTEISNGTYTSVTFDMGEGVDSLGRLTYKSALSIGTGANVEVLTASSPVDSGWETATWQPLLNIGQNSDGTTYGNIQSAPNRFMRYQLKLTRSREETVTTHELAGPDLSSGVFDNTVFFQGVVRIQDTTQPGSYISPVMRFDNNEGWISQVFSYTLPFNSGGVVVKTMSSDDQSELLNATMTDPDWLPLNQDGTLQSLPKRFLVIKFELTPGRKEDNSSDSPLVHGLKIEADTFAYHSPNVSLVYIRANTFYMTKESPVLRSIRIAGKYENIVTQELHITSLSSEVLSNKELYRVTDKTVGTLVDEDLAAKNVDRTFLVLNRYEIKTKVPGVILTSRDFNDDSIIMDGNEIQNGYVYAQTTDLADEFVYDQIKIRVKEDNTALVSPVPQQGCPVIVRDASGVEMFHVPFFDEYGRVTLDYQETVRTDGRDMIVLTYPNLDVSTLKLEIYHQNEQVWQQIIPEKVDHHFVTLDIVYPDDTEIRATYRIKHSFCVDYNHDPQAQFVKFHFHGAVLDSTREVKVWYETNTDSAYHVSKEIDLNPMKHGSHAGFIYLTDKVESAYKMEMFVPSDVMYANGHDTAYVIVRVVDRLGNPVSGDVIRFITTEGQIQTIQNRTDINGFAVARFTAGLIGGLATITAINTSTHIEVSKNILLKVETLEARTSLVSSSYSINLSETVTITAYVVNERQEHVQYSDVVFTVDGVSRTIKTDYYGEASFAYTPATEGLKVIETSVPALGLSETMLVHVNGGTTNV